MNQAKWFVVFAVVFGLFALYHLVGVFYEIDTSPWWRHLIFFGLSLFGIYGLLKRPGYFIYLFVILIIQQFYSHGTDLINMWVEFHKIDWISLFVLIFLPIVFVFLLLDKLKKKNI